MHDPDNQYPRSDGSDGVRNATFAEKQLPAAPNDQNQPPEEQVFGSETQALAAQWRIFARFATGVAILTAPVFFLVLYRALGWSALAAGLVAALGVFAFRGLLDLVSRALIPYPSMFGDDGRLREADIVSRRRAWFWRSWFRRIVVLGTIYLFIALIAFLVHASNGDTSITSALSAPGSWLGDQFGNAEARSSLIGLALTLPLFLVFNVIILLGPLLYAGIKQINAFEPGDADWGVRMADVRGQAEPKEEIRRIVGLWQAGDEFERAGGKRERGVLFLGAPGTGKTMLAKAIASGFNCPFVSVPGSAFAQTFIGVDVILVMWLSWRARRLARKWGGQCIVFIDEIDAVGMRRASLGGAHAGPVGQPSLHDLCFYGPYGAINPSGDLVVENAAWRERMFASRAEGPRSLYSAPVQRLADSIRTMVFPGVGGTMGQGGLQQLLVAMDGVSTPSLSRRLLVNRLNTWLDATYVIPSRIKNLRLRLAPARPRSEQLYFIGACNAPLEALDPALTRPGRMGRHVQFRTPNRDDRKDIFDLYLAKVAHDAELDTDRRRDELARITMGHSPAMIEQVCSLALTNAHHDGRLAFEWRDLLEAITVVEAGIESGFKYGADEARATAIHEAGHAVTGHIYMKGHTSTRLTIKPRGNSGGHHMMQSVDERMFKWRHERFADLVWSLGALAAERVFYNENANGVAGDISSATAVAAMMVGVTGMPPETPDLSEKFATEAEARVAERKLMRRFEQLGAQIMNRATMGSALQGDPVATVLGDPGKQKMVAEILGQAYLTAYWFVQHNREATERVAERLLERREIFGDDVLELLDSVHLTIPNIDPLDEANWPRI